MTGVSVSAWRAGIGLFNRKIICKNIVKGSKNYDCPFIVDHFRTSMNLLGKPFEILFSLLLLFFLLYRGCYVNTHLHSCLPVQGYYQLHLLYPSLSSIKVQYFLHPIQIFLWINLKPKNVSYATKCSFSFYKKSVSEEVKNIMFFIIVSNFIGYH